MFNYKDDYEPFEFVKIDNTRGYFKEYIADSLVVDIDAGNLTSQEYKTLLFIWFLGTFFHSIMPSKVLLATIGEVKRVVAKHLFYVVWEFCYLAHNMTLIHYLVSRKILIHWLQITIWLYLIMLIRVNLGLMINLH